MTSVGPEAAHVTEYGAARAPVLPLDAPFETLNRPPTPAASLIRMSEQPSIGLRKRSAPVVPFDRSFDPSDGLECLAHDPDAWLWTVDARDDEGRPCAHARVTVAVRPLRRPAG